MSDFDNPFAVVIAVIFGNIVYNRETVKLRFTVDVCLSFFSVSVLWAALRVLTNANSVNDIDGFGELKFIRAIV